jgi:hypothetical protein
MYIYIYITHILKKNVLRNNTSNTYRKISLHLTRVVYIVIFII